MENMLLSVWIYQVKVAGTKISHSAALKQAVEVTKCVTARELPALPLCWSLSAGSMLAENNVTMAAVNVAVYTFI